MDEKDLKIAALRERLRDIVDEYENKVADLRVALTIQQQQIESSEVNDNQPAPAPEVLEGEVVD